MSNLLRCLKRVAAGGYAALILTSLLMMTSLLAACASQPEPVSAPSAPAVGQSEMPAVELCDTDAVQYAVGEPFDEANVHQWQSESGAQQVRVLRPDSVATMDHRPDRLNIHISESEVIESLRCG